MKMNWAFLSAAAHTGTQALSSVNSDIYWKHNISPTAEMQEFNLAGLIFIYLPGVFFSFTDLPLIT